VRSKPNFPALLEAFFTDRLMSQRNVSPNTVTSYRDCFRLLLRYAQECTKKAPSKLTLEDLDATFIGKFLSQLEKTRGNSAQTRNVRLAAIHSFFNYVAFQHPEYSALIQRVLAIPCKRFKRTLVGSLTPSEVDVILSAPDRKTWGGRRDHALFTLAVHTGLRVSELTGLCCKDVELLTAT
jgi:site-specific recombinase XerD